ncbi:MAG TPA: PDZ domain-containing protein [Myxococcota bacterium]|jgi:hypothetical protein|nr:PDZ domain-containing protein [Myxococcota bacterium]
MDARSFRRAATVLLALGTLLAAAPAWAFDPPPGPTDKAPSPADEKAPKVYVWGTDPWLGIEGEDVSSDDGRATLALPPGTRGALVTKVYPDSPAAAAGLVPGDVVVRFGGLAISSFGDLQRAVMDAGVGARVVMGLRRGGAFVKKTATLDVKPAEAGTDDPGDAGSWDAYGSGTGAHRKWILRLGPAGRGGASAAPRGDADDSVDAGDDDGDDVGGGGGAWGDPPDLDALFPPGWDDGLDPGMAKELRRLVEEMRTVISGARRSVAPARSDLKDPFGAPSVRAPYGGDGEAGPATTPAPKPKARHAAKPSKPAPAKPAATDGAKPKVMPEVEVLPAPAPGPDPAPPTTPAPRRARPGT